MLPSLPVEIWSMICKEVALLETGCTRRHRESWSIEDVQPGTEYISALRLVNRELLAAATPFLYNAAICYLRWKPSWSRLETYADSPTMAPYLKTLAFAEWPNSVDSTLSPDDLQYLDQDEILFDIGHIGLRRRLVEVVNKLGIEQVIIWNLSPRTCMLLREVLEEARFPVLRSLAFRIFSKTEVADIDDYLPCSEDTTSMAKPVFSKQISSIERLEIIRHNLLRSVSYAHLAQQLSAVREFTSDMDWTPLPTLKFPTTLISLTLGWFSTKVETLLLTIQHCAVSLQRLSLYEVILRKFKNEDDVCGWSIILNQLKDMPQLYNTSYGNQLKLGRLRYSVPLPVWAYYGGLLSAKTNDRLAWKSLRESAGPKGLLVKSYHPSCQEWVTIEEAKVLDGQEGNESLQKCFVQPEGKIRCLGNTSPRFGRYCTMGRPPIRTKYARCQKSRRLRDQEDPEIATWWCPRHTLDEDNSDSDDD